MSAQAVNGTSGAVNRGLRRYAEALGYRRAARKALGDDADPDFCLTDFLFRVATDDGRRLHKSYGAERSKTAMSVTGGGSVGGWLVPTELRLELMQDVGEEALIRPKATVVPMASSELRLPLPDATTAQSAGVAPFFGGISMAWTQEAATRPETEPTFRQVTLKAWELTGYAKESNPLYQDGGPGLESFLRRLFARSIAWYEDYSYFNGDGVGKPQGMIGCTAAALQTRGSSSHFTHADAKGMVAQLLPASWPRACWFMHPLALEDLVDLATTTTATWQGNQPREPGSGPVGALHTLPVYVSEKLPALGTKGDVVLLDPLLYVIGDRGAVEISVSKDEPTSFLNNQCVWRVVYRGDGQPWFSDLITLPDASTLVSPYVVLV